MAWQTPKTDWAVRYDADGHYIGDYFNAADFSRIKGNLEHLRNLAAAIGPAPAALDIPTVTVASYGYASTIDALERALDQLLTEGLADPGLPPRKTWRGNDAAPLASDINRIETSCLMLRQMLDRVYAMLPKLPAKLGGATFG